MAMTGGTAKLVASGTPSGWPDSIKLYIYYKEKTQSVADNTTVLSLGVYVTTPSGWSIGKWDDFNGSYVGTATSGGDCKTFNGTVPSGTMGTRWLAENLDVTVKHNDDGTKKATIYWKWGVNSPWGKITNPSGAFTVDLTTIPRASAITSASDITLGNACNVKWTPHSASFYYRLNFRLGAWSYTTGVIVPNTTAAYTFTGYKIPLDVAEQITASGTGTMTATLYTYSDSGATKQVGSADTETFKVTVPKLLPSVSMTVTPVSSLSTAFAGLYIQGKTKVRATVTGIGQYKAGIKSLWTKVEGKTYGGQGNTFTSGYISGYGSMNIEGYATDTRDNTGSAVATINVHSYSRPLILPVSGEKEVVAARCDAYGELSDSGTYLLIKAKRSYSSVGGRNKCQIQYRYKLLSATSYGAWTTILAKTSSDSDEIITAPLLDGTLSVKSTYEVQVRVIDDIGEQSYTTIKIPTDKVFCHRGWNSIAYGGYIEEDDTFAIKGSMKFKVMNEVWEDLGLSGSVAPSESNCGRGPAGTGCWYRVVNGNHVQVAFNCSLGYTGSALQINLASIPAEYRPQRNVYSICATGGRAAARILVNNSGNVLLDWIQVLSTAEATTASTVAWIDGYIDYYL